MTDTDVSYARFGFDGSDVYVYADVGGWYDCCACSLNPEGLGGFECDTAAEMVAHLNRHVEAGQTVPAYTFERLNDPAEDAENQARWRRRRERSE